jgi:hypothetical protein
MHDEPKTHTYCALRYLAIILLGSFVDSAWAANQDLQPAFAIRHIVKHEQAGTVDGGAGGMDYEQRRDNGAIRVLNGVLSFASGTDTRIDTQGKSTVGIWP